MSSHTAFDCADQVRISKSVGIFELGLVSGNANMVISTDRYTSPEFAAKEREKIWMKVWQAAGRVDEIPQPGDWKEHRIYDQSFIIARGKDDRIRAFVNSCTHRGNALCVAKKGHSARFTCPYHLWSFNLEGQLVGMGQPHLVGDLDKKQHGLIQVSADTLAGFIFINPDPDAMPLREYIGEDIVSFLEPYKLDEMTPVMDVKEALECNWKVVNDAFQESYHIQGIHPELLSVIESDIHKNRYNFINDHNLAVAPFEVKKKPGFGPEEEVAGIMALPATFPGVAQVLPAFEQRVATYRNEAGELEFPEGVSGVTLLQQATRQTLGHNGLDVSGLSDEQMTTNHGYLLFPNFFMTVRAGECHIIVTTPHPDGDPNRCVWHVASYMWLPPSVRDEYRAAPVEVEEAGSYPYFLALQQDYEQMPRQQRGLRNKGLTHITLAQEEVCIANFHSKVDQYLAR